MGYLPLKGGGVALAAQREIGNVLHTSEPFPRGPLDTPASQIMEVSGTALPTRTLHHILSRVQGFLIICAGAILILRLTGDAVLYAYGSRG